MKRFFILGVFSLIFDSVALQKTYANNDPAYSINYPIAKQIIQTVSKKLNTSITTLKQRLVAYKNTFFAKEKLEKDTLIKQLHALRDKYYQYRVWLVARKMEGKNIYHNYGYNGKNDESNTCVNGWCQVMAGTGVGKLRELAYGKVHLLKKTLEIEKQKLQAKTPGKKIKANLSQKIPQYINVERLVSKTSDLGFIPIDVDLAKRGDMLVQYYWKQRQEFVFAPQHVSILDYVLDYKNGIYEIRDWHEGIKGQPYIYRNGYNMESSFNNLLTYNNMYFGYTGQRGQERNLISKNKNIYQAFGYFGNQTEKARMIVLKLDISRARLVVYKKVFEVLLASVE
ncbi:hypothetical protein [uncultured Microscilla sp.]|uniref:hypothetical protein n=1 Tax=uncultured Microscilla sp. TaxID=432653 RepID=UPI002632D959|nr:hypothetical protein [uncultured Microscilla sp.]